MKKLFLVTVFILSLVSSGLGQAQQYHLGVPVYDSIYTFVPYSQSPFCSYDVAINPNIFSVSGVELYLVVDTIVDPSGSAIAYPIGTTDIGDTLPLPSTLTGGGYQFKFTGGVGSYANCRLMAEGVPTTAGEKYICDSYATIMSSATCENYLTFLGVDTCEVLNSVNLSETNHTRMKYYPNPTSDLLYIDLGPEQTIDNIGIFSSLGQLIYSKKGNGNRNLSIPVSNFSKGLFTVLIAYRSGLTETFSFVRE
ncbi:MAG TPA: hypothetical protein DCF89_06315 [Flavobacteriales bacterium]|mgnify:CR=1 FL=1|nr:hypothetical protein [Flavobacteriales bacterium]